MSKIDDNPVRRLQHQFEMEDLATSPVTEAVLKMAEALPVPELLKKGADFLAGRLNKQAEERRNLLVETVADETVKYGAELDRLKKSVDEHSERTKPEVMAELLLDATRKAQNTRAKERVQRIALILFNALVEPKEADADEVEEMMRVAMEVSDSEIVHLRELVKIEGSQLAGRDHIPRYDAHSAWINGFWGDRVVPEVDSVFQKLESYGLVTRIAPPNNQNIMADIQNRYVLLPKGVRFVNLIKSRASS
jgi:hypothetical protein